MSRLFVVMLFELREEEKERLPLLARLREIHAPAASVIASTRYSCTGSQCPPRRRAGKSEALPRLARTLGREPVLNSPAANSGATRKPSAARMASKPFADVACLSAAAGRKIEMRKRLARYRADDRSVIVQPASPASHTYARVCKHAPRPRTQSADTCRCSAQFRARPRPSQSSLGMKARARVAVAGPAQSQRNCYAGRS